MNFTDIVSALLKIQGISINKMLADLKLGAGTFATWQSRNSVPNAKILSKIADYFNVSTDYLLGRDAPAATANITPMLPADTQKLVDICDALNSAGVKKLTDYAQDLTFNPQYARKSAIAPRAAAFGGNAKVAPASDDAAVERSLYAALDEAEKE